MQLNNQYTYKKKIYQMSKKIKFIQENIQWNNSICIIIFGIRFYACNICYRLWWVDELWLHVSQHVIFGATTRDRWWHLGWSAAWYTFNTCHGESKIQILSAGPPVTKTNVSEAIKHAHTLVHRPCVQRANKEWQSNEAISTKLIEF